MNVESYHEPRESREQDKEFKREWRRRLAPVPVPGACPRLRRGGRKSGRRIYHEPREPREQDKEFKRE